MKKKLTLVVLGTILVSYILLLVASAINIRNIGIKGAGEKAIIAAELVKDGLTAHMVSGIMENREYFLNKIGNSPNIHALWVTRSQSVIDQFGVGFNSEVPRDSIDKEVLKSGKTHKSIIETSNSAQLRVTLPYSANSHANPNCMTCHEAKEGDVLGTVSIIIDIDDVRLNGIATSLFIFGVSLIMMLVVFFIISRSITPVTALFESITYVMGKAKDGDYSHRVYEVDKSPEYQNVTFWVNSLLDKLQDTLEEIDKTLKEFLTQDRRTNKDMLLELKSLIREISDIHKFKKTIEFDEDKLQVYARIGTILKEKFGLSDFVLVENDTKHHVGPKVVFSEGDKESYTADPQCRALRTKQVVNSEQFPNICEHCSRKYKHYFCVPFTISSDLEVLLHLGSDSTDMISQIKDKLVRFEDYINEARPEIVSKNLTEILRISSTTDPLTGLFNRKYLDEYIDKASAQAKRSKIHFGVLMIDIDYFKMVNDTYGHDVGDEVIRVLSNVLKKSIRESDIAFRFGGEEFLVLLYQCDEANIEEIAQKIRINFEMQSIKPASAKAFNKTLSIGASIFPDDADSIWKAIKYADISLYRAKESGRNKVVRFDPSFLQESGISNDF